MKISVLYIGWGERTVFEPESSIEHTTTQVFTNITKCGIFCFMINSEVSCGNCAGACCVDSIVVLSADEALLLDQNGTELLPILKAFVNIDPTPEEIRGGALSSWSDPKSIEHLERRIEEADDETLKSFLGRSSS